MSTTAKPVPPIEAVDATVTSKGQITIPIQIRRTLGVKAKDKLTFRPNDDGSVTIVRKLDENRFERYRGIGNGIPELDGGIDEIVRYMREMRGHDEVDDLIFGTER